MNFCEICFLTVADVEEQHNAMLREFGGLAGIRDAGLLESAVMALQSGYNSTVSELASALAHGLALNHPFLDGNKRTALGAAAAFLGANGLAPVFDASWFETMVDVARGVVSRNELTARFAAAIGGDVTIDG